MTDRQIETYERPYNVVYGTFGEKPSVVSGAEGPDWPVWRARRMVVALLTTQMNKLTANDPERDALKAIKEEFQQATTGEVMWGMIRKWKNRHGVQRFIGLVERGRDYKRAGQTPMPVRPSVPRPFPDVPPTSRRKPIEESEAERIADRMAKAARRAVEGDSNR
jgi:hypothetical protein